MKVSDYLPKLYDNNLEMKNIIDSEEVEFETGLKQNIDNAFKDTFAIKATEKGIKQFEEIFDIKPNEDDTLLLRRQRVINRLIRQIPFTERFMISKLNEILGEGNWNYTLNYNTYKLTINSVIPGRNWYLELVTFLDGIIPCNIDYEIVIYATSWDLVNANFTTWQDVYDTEMTWQDVMDGEWLNS